MGEKTKKKWRWMLPAVLLVVAAAAVQLRWWMRPMKLQSDRRKTVTVNDGVRPMELLPRESVPVSELAVEAFSRQGDLVVYSGARQGIDVSEHQGVIDWRQVADSGVSFVFIRLGFRGATEGGLYTDARFAENWAGARAAGLDVGVYFFSQALNEREAAEEADFVLQTLGTEKPALPVMFDWEPVYVEQSRTQGREAQALTDCAAAFCRRITEVGLEAGIYFNRQQGYYSYDLLPLKDYAFWVADPGDSPDFYYAFRFWQYSFTGAVPGIDTVVDRNLMFAEASEEGGGE